LNYNIIWKQLYEYDFELKQIPGYPGYKCNRSGDVFRPDGSKIKPFQSNGYLQVYLINDKGKRSIKGVHQVVSMTFDSRYYPGCIVHHKDEDKKHNHLANLKPESISEHTRHHADPSRLTKWIAKNGPINKGKRMSESFKNKCRESALKRHMRERNMNNI